MKSRLTVWLARSNILTNQSAERGLISISLNVKLVLSLQNTTETNTKGTVVGAVVKQLAAAKSI